MFERVMGLPAHPLLVHTAVVLVPLLALGGVLYAVAPFARRYFRWPLILIALAAPAAVAAAKLSGDTFSKHNNFRAPDMQATIGNHKEFGDVLLWLTLGLGAAVLVLAFALPGRVAAGADRTPDDTLVEPARRSGGMLVIQVVVGIITVGLAVANMYYVFKAGDSGAQMVWNGY